MLFRSQPQGYLKAWKLTQSAMPTVDAGVIVASSSTFGGGTVPIQVQGIFQGYDCKGKFTIPGLPPGNASLLSGVDLLSNPTINNQTGGLFIAKSLKSLLLRTYDAGLFQSSKDINIAARINNIIIAGGSNYAIASSNRCSPPWQRGATSQSTVMS